MPTHVALLRGINVGGRNRVAMADLRQVVGTTLFLHTPGGLGRSEPAARLTRLGGSRTAETAGTARNWATVNKLLALCDG
jgi:uncharacterized protein (DUF1697 family)